MSLKVGDNVVLVSNSLDPAETPSYSASYQDPRGLHMELQLRFACEALIFCFHRFTVYINTTINCFLKLCRHLFKCCIKIDSSDT